MDEATEAFYFTISERDLHLLLTRAAEGWDPEELLSEVFIAALVF